MPKNPVLAEIQLVGGFFLECAILNDAPDEVLRLPELSGYRLRQQVAPSFDLATEQVVIDLAIACQPLTVAGEVLTAISGRFRLHLTFRVLHLHDYLEEAEGEPHLVPNRQLILTVIGVAYSTARGMLVAKTTDTILQSFVLPLLDVRDLARSRAPVS